MATTRDEMRARVRRVMFRPRVQESYVVVRPLRLTSTIVLQPGTEIRTSEVRRHQLKRWYERRHIGAKGDPWVDVMLDLWEAKGGIVVVPDEAPMAPAAEIQTVVETVVPQVVADEVPQVESTPEDGDED